MRLCVDMIFMKDAYYSEASVFPLDKILSSSADYI